MANILKTPDGKVVRLSKNDIRLYEAPCNPPNTGQKYLSGTNLYVHKARSSNLYFYTVEWSLWQGSENTTTLISKQEAIDFMLDKMEGGYWVCPSDERIKTAKEYLGEFDKETA